MIVFGADLLVLLGTCLWYGMVECCFARGSLQVNPALKEHHAEFLLKELYKRWGNHKIMVRWLSRFFNYLDRYGAGALSHAIAPLTRASKGPLPAHTTGCAMPL